MIYLRRERGRIRNGLNLYPLSDPNHFGGILRIGRLILRARYSKPFSKWHFNYSVWEKHK